MADNGSDGGVESGENALRLAQRIAEKNTGLAGLLVGSPPGIDLGLDLGLSRPSVDRKAEGGFRNKSVTANRLESGTSDIRLELVIPGDDPYFAAPLDSHLGGSEDMPGGMKGDPGGIEVNRLAVSYAFHNRIASDPRAQQCFAGPGGEIALRTPTGVIGMTVRDKGPVDRTPRIDVEISGLTVKAFFCD